MPRQVRCFTHGAREEGAAGRAIPGGAVGLDYEPTLASSSLVAALTILNCSA